MSSIFNRIMPYFLYLFNYKSILYFHLPTIFRCEVNKKHLLLNKQRCEVSKEYYLLNKQRVFVKKADF